MGKKYTYEEVKSYLWFKGYILLDDNYINSNKNLNFKDKEDYYYFGCLSNIKDGWIPAKVHKNNPYTIQNIKLWCKLNNKPYELINNKYEGRTKKLKWKCLNPECNEIFRCDWSYIQCNRGCGVCHGFQVTFNTCLATKNPELTLDWHPTKNGDITPYNVTCGSDKKVWWQCKNNDEHVWKATVSNRTNGNTRCPYCAGKLASKDYNLLIINPDLCKEWDYSKNTKNPREYLPNSRKKVWWICKECSNEWNTSIGCRNGKKSNCPECAKSHGEIEIRDLLKIYQIIHDPQKTFNGLIGLKNGLLSYDFYLPNYNLLIEYQGLQHEKPVDFKGKGKKYAEEQFKIQKEHDRRKHQYAKDNNIKLLEIWYYDFDKIEDILENELLILNEGVTK